MGVYELETYMKTHLKGGIDEVSLIGEIAIFRRKYKVGKPVLVFDIMSLIGFLCERKITDVLCGGRYNIYSEILHQLFTRLSEHADLVFFKDAHVQQQKIQTWAKRQDQQYTKSIKVMNEVAQGVPLKEIAQKYDPHLGTTLMVIEDQARKHGQLNLAVNLECDQELAMYAFKNPRVLGVFSNDSDFLIFAGKWKYFSTRDINPSTLVTKKYSRIKLRNDLNLSDFQMSIFATIAGNDIIPHEVVQKFHNQSFGFQLKKTFLGLAAYIKMNFASQENHLKILKAIRKNVFNGKMELKRINASINSYNVHLKKPACDDKFLEYCLGENYLFSYNIMTNAPFMFSLIYYDLRQNMPYYDIAVPMFQRQAGIILQPKQSTAAAVDLSVYCKRYHDDVHRQLIIAPIYPPFEVPPLEELFSSSSEWDHVRFKLLKWTIHWNNLKSFDLENIPALYFADILSILFMKYNNTITKKEADIILWTIKIANQAKVPEQIAAPTTVDPRAFRLAFLYPKVYSNILRSIEVCGLKKYLKPINFDGVYFHHQYLQYKDRPFKTEAIFEDL